MRKILFLFGASLLVNLCWAQLPSAYVALRSELPPGWTVRLEQALLDASFGMDSLQPVVLQTKAFPLRETQSDQLQHQVMIQYEVTLTLRMSGTDELLANESFTIDGVGRSQRQALRSCGQGIRYTKSPVKTALDALHTTYRQRLYDQCDVLVRQVEHLRQRQQLTAALALADGIPVDATCASTARTQRDLAYQAYQTAYCEAHLQAAELSLAQQKPAATLTELAKIDPASPCAAQVRVLLKQATELRDEQQAAKATFLRQVYQNQIGIEQARTEIITNIIEQD
ncbi:MAG: hypothetical protein AAGJ82_12445 [Bacteroidota bacterium]